MTSCQLNIFLFWSSQELPRLRLGPLKGFLSWHGALQGPSPHGLLPELQRKKDTLHFFKITFLYQSLIVKIRQKRIELVARPASPSVLSEAVMEPSLSLTPRSFKSILIKYQTSNDKKGRLFGLRLNAAAVVRWLCFDLIPQGGFHRPNDKSVKKQTLPPPMRGLKIQ